MKNFVIFGASGDLAKKYLFPSLDRIVAQGHQFNFFGFGRSPAVIPPRYKYVVGQYNATGLTELASQITSDTIFYFALPTQVELVEDIINGLNFHHLIDSKTRLVIEKPFGTDFKTAKTLMDFLDVNVGQDKIFLVDHYLTKHLVKNFVALRFNNDLFKYLWNPQFIKEINITATETRGTEGRGGYYDQTGEIRDMFQNHLLQLLSLTTMEEPKNYNRESYVSQKVAILKSLKFKPSDVEIGQYRDYRNEKDIDPHSTTETLAKIRLTLDHPNWKNIPINIVSGKKLEQKVTEINIVFNNSHPKLIPNQLNITLQPQNDIFFTLNSPQPVTLNLGPLDSSIDSASAYENLFHDLINDVKINTPSFAEILLQWQLTDKILSIPNLRNRLFIY